MKASNLITKLPLEKSDRKRMMTNPIAKSLPQFRHKRFQDKTKYNRKTLIRMLKRVIRQQYGIE
jgi:hypothetical protein